MKKQAGRRKEKIPGWDVEILIEGMRIVAGVLSENFLKIQFQDFSSFLYDSKRCSPKSSHRLCLLVLEYQSTSLLESGSRSLNSPSSSLLDGLLIFRDARAPVSTALPS